jgi:hypothetical protein
MFIPVNSLSRKRIPSDPTFTVSDASNSNLTTYTFSGKSIGPASAGRRVFVATFASPVASVTSVTIGGIAATEAVTGTNSGSICALYYANVPTGATADIVVTFNTTAFYSAIGIWYDAGGGDIGETKTSTSATYSDTIAVQENGGLIGVACTQNQGTGRFTFTGVTEDFEQDSGSSGEHMGGGSAAISADDATRAIGVTISNPNSPVIIFAAIDAP